MGKGTIISGGNNGQYQVQINYDRTAYTAELSKLTPQITEYETKISDKEAEIITLENEYSAMLTAGYLSDALQEKQNEILSAETEKSSLEVYKLSFEKRKQYLEGAMPDDVTVSAWCADLTENLTGVVGTIEIPGESTNIQVQPGYAGNAVYNQTRDGQLLPTVVASSAQAFYNLAMMPGWQKWKPTFRYATITALNGDAASISLENILSSQQALGINQTATIDNVAINYMDCNGGAFKIGDSVLVKFTGQAWTTPVIIGFKENPVICCIFSEQFLTGSFDFPWAYSGNFTAPNIGTRTWIVKPTWTESVTPSGDAVLIDFTYSGGSNSIDYGPPTGVKYFTNGAESTGRYISTISEIALGAGILIVDIGIDIMEQTPYTYATPANRATIDILITVEGLYEGAWSVRYAALRFNVNDVGKDGVFAGDLLDYLNTNYSWAESWRIAANGIYIEAEFEQVYYPDVVGSDTPTNDISARIKATIRSIKVCGNAPDGATIGNIINPSNGGAISF